MTFFLLFLVVGGTLAGDLFKAAAMRRAGPIDDFRPRSLGRGAVRVAGSPLIWLSLVGYTLSFFAFMALLSIVDVSFAVPATAAGYVVETLLAKTLLGETISARRWASALLVTCGVMLIST